MSKYVHIPDVVNFQDVANKKFNLSSSQYIKLVMPNKNYKYVRDFLCRKLLRTDLGVEVGSLSYIDKSPVRFIRTKALQAHSFLPEFNKETALPILPSEFVQMNLKEGDLLISKDSNIGEIVILDKDYPDCMLSGAIYKLPVKDEWRYYLLAFIKADIFREQLDFMVPKGATIRHAKTMFLDCKIPLPNVNAEKVVRYISLLTEAIINKEKLIRQRHTDILRLIEKELIDNQKPIAFSYHLPSLNEVKENGRLDTGIYEKVFKQKDFLIKNYQNGFFFIKEDLIGSGCTPQVRYIGKESSLKYQWVTPSFCSDYGTIAECRINQQGTNNINKDAILIINRTSKGGVGEFVGITSFYNFDELGMGQHNQGLYRITSFPKLQLLFILCCLNCEIYRKLCAALSVGSKMKELKSIQISTIPFPNFPEHKQKEIATLYHNPREYPSDDFSLENFLEKDNEYNLTAGIYELDKTAKHLKEKLDKAIDDIVNDREVEIAF